MRIAAIHIAEGSFPEVFGFDHAEMTINLGGINLYTVKDDQIVNTLPNEFYLEDILDASVSLLSCIVGGNGGGKTTLLRMLTADYHFQYIIEYSANDYYLSQNIELFHRVYYTPYFNHNTIDSINNNGKDLSKTALIKIDNHGDSALLNDFLEAHFSENSKRWIRFNHFYRKLQSFDIILPIFNKIKLSLIIYKTNFHNTPRQLRPALELILEKIQSELTDKEITRNENLPVDGNESEELLFLLRFEYDLYKTAIGKIISILERAGNTYLEEGNIPDDYEARIEELNVRNAIEWFLVNASVYRKNGKESSIYSFSRHLPLMNLIDYTLSLANIDGLTDSWLEIIINEGQAFRVIELYDQFNNSFNNAWFNFDTKPMFEFSPEINVSSGEQQFLNLFSTLYYHARNIEEEINIDLHSNHSLKYLQENVLLLIDEGDNAFHPQWKKQFVSYLRKILPLIFNGFNIQIIITSHDPLTLSDIPKNNVVFLQKINSRTVIASSSTRRTFGANISDLLKDSFFLEDNQIGSYVGEVIDSIISQMSSSSLTDENIKRIERIIRAIDEPIIQFKLAEMLGEAIGDNRLQKEVIDNEIAKLQERRNLL